MGSPPPTFLGELSPLSTFKTPNASPESVLGAAASSRDPAQAVGCLHVLCTRRGCGFYSEWDLGSQLLLGDCGPHRSQRKLSLEGARAAWP